VRSHLSVREQPLGGSVCLLALRGELDRTTVAGLVVKLKRGGAPEGRPGVIVDLTELTSLDPIGVRSLQDSPSGRRGGLPSCGQSGGAGRAALGTHLEERIAGCL